MGSIGFLIRKTCLFSLVALVVCRCYSSPADVVSKSWSQTMNSSSQSISKYYQKLAGQVSRSVWLKREQGDVQALAIHRGLGSQKDKTVQYRLIQECLNGNLTVEQSKSNGKVMDAGCGFGSGISYFDRLGWDMEGYTLSENQYKFIKTYFPNETVFFSSYDKIDQGVKYSSIYAIETLWYSNWRYTLEHWERHLQNGGRIALIDDFAVNKTSALNDPDIKRYVDGWMLKGVTSVDNLCAFITKYSSLRCIQIRDLTEEFDVNKNNYGNRPPPRKSSWKNQAREGLYFRYESSIKGTLKYLLTCLQKS